MTRAERAEVSRAALDRATKRAPTQAVDGEAAKQIARVCGLPLGDIREALAAGRAASDLLDFAGRRGFFGQRGAR